MQQIFEKHEAAKKEYNDLLFDAHYPLVVEWLAARNPDLLFYGPHPCPNACGVQVCITTRAKSPVFVFEYPEGPIYPNTYWKPHVCQKVVKS